MSSNKPQINQRGAASEPIPLDRCEVRMVNPERVAATTKRMPSPELTEQLAETFRVLCEPARVRIVTALLEAGELCVCDIAAVTGLSETNTSQHLRVLRANRAVRARRESRTVYYALDDAHVRMLLDVGLAHAGEGAAAE